MRSFHDSDGTEWTVFEVRRQLTSRGEWSVLPNGFNGGWLCFESAGSKKRLVQFPDRWREFSEPELEKLLGKAVPAPRSAWRIADDLTGGDGDTAGNSM